jgi:methylated-DNA-[protein]-cysteine S-methyltransferase
LTIGTEFQKKVWRYLQKITYSTTASYLELANKTGNENAVRAVANANGANALAIIIPCHRVIASDGSLGGYAGGVPLKRYLLNLEKDT